MSKKIKKILGLDLGSNSIGWALMNEENGEVNQIIDLGSRIFNKAVEEKTPTPKNQKRRDMRLGRRVLQRRVRRKQKMINYLISLKLLPSELTHNFGQEKLLNELGNPYELRVKALDKQLEPYELGRVLLHFVARRGFLSSKKQIAGDLVDDPDTQEYLAEIDKKPTKDKDEKGFKEDIDKVYQAIEKAKSRTLGEYLFHLDAEKVKRNRSHSGGHLRTDRGMYKSELEQIWQTQKIYFDLPDDFFTQIEKIIFYQRPLKLKKNRVGKCLLEPKHNRANMARLEVQRFRYLLDINNLKYSEPDAQSCNITLSDDQRKLLFEHLEQHETINITKMRQLLGLTKHHKINLELKNIKGNVSACEIRSVIEDIWDQYSPEKKSQLFEDLFTIKKKSALKKRLMKHWGFDTKTAVKLCLLEFESGHSNHSLKAIKKLLPYLENGYLYDKARVKASYGYEIEKSENLDKLPIPPQTSNPIVNKGLHELKRVVNALIKHHKFKPDVIRIEMARDLEMNTQRYKDNEEQQKKNKESNKKAEQEFKKYHPTRNYATKEQKLKYRLWKEQKYQCIYSGKLIAIEELWSNAVEIDHIVPRSLCLDDTYTNKVVCLTKENRDKRQRTPIQAWGDNKVKWDQISKRINTCYPDRPKKKYRKNTTHPKKQQFEMREDDIKNKYGMSAAQLNDTRYISRLAKEYLKQLGGDVSVTKGAIVAEVRRQWGLNNVIGQTNKKERTDHRHHTIDAVVIGHINRSFHNKMVHAIKRREEGDKGFTLEQPYNNFRAEIEEKLKQIIVSHAPQRQLSGALHEETAAGYIAKHDGLVYRKALNTETTIKNVEKIVDEQVRAKALEHIENYDNNPKRAFNEENLKQLKLGKNPIKRVRILQSSIKTTKNKTAEDTLQVTKFGVKDKSGKVFKYMSYGNTHHVEIIKNRKTEEVKGEFVTMMKASHRVRGINMPKQPIIKTDHGDKWEFLMALHINDMVSAETNNSERGFYRIQKLGMMNNTIVLRLHLASTLNNKDQELNIGLKSFDKYKIKQHKINAIGVDMLIDD